MIPNNGLSSRHLTLPDFLIPRLKDTFCSITSRYIEQLAFLDTYARDMAWRDLPLSKYIARQTMFRNSDVIVLEGPPGIHAEIRLLQYILDTASGSPVHVGIGMLCCVHCAYTYKQFGLWNMVWGCHGQLYDHWIFPDALLSNEARLQTFLGTCYEDSKGKPGGCTQRKARITELMISSRASSDALLPSAQKHWSHSKFVLLQRVRRSHSEADLDSIFRSPLAPS
jgi:hypothetical protein